MLGNLMKMMAVKVEMSKRECTHLIAECITIQGMPWMDGIIQRI